MFTTPRGCLQFPGIEGLSQIVRIRVSQCVSAAFGLKEGWVDQTDLSVLAGCLRETCVLQKLAHMSCQKDFMVLSYLQGALNSSSV